MPGPNGAGGRTPRLSGREPLPGTLPPADSGGVGAPQATSGGEPLGGRMRFPMRPTTIGAIIIKIPWATPLDRGSSRIRKVPALPTSAIPSANLPLPMLNPWVRVRTADSLVILLVASSFGLATGFVACAGRGCYPERAAGPSIGTVRRIGVTTFAGRRVWRRGIACIPKMTLTTILHIRIGSAKGS